MGGDAVTFLSNNWSDAQHQTTAVKRNNWPATNTEVNGAILAGHSPTACDHEVCGNKPYGGGLENSPCFLENWNADVLPDRGSLVFLFYDTQGNGPWKFSTWGNAGQYYWPLPPALLKRAAEGSSHRNQRHPSRHIVIKCLPINLILWCPEMS